MRKNIIYALVFFVVLAALVIWGFLECNDIDLDLAHVTGQADTGQDSVAVYVTSEGDAPPVRLGPDDDGFVADIDDFFDLALQRIEKEEERERAKQLADRTNPTTYHRLYAVCKIGHIYRGRLGYEAYGSENADRLEALWNNARRNPPDTVIQAVKELTSLFWQEGGLLSETAYKHLYDAVFVLDRAIQSEKDSFLYWYWKAHSLLTLHPQRIVTEDVDRLTLENIPRVFMPFNISGNQESMASVLSCYALLKEGPYPESDQPELSAYARDILYEIIDSPVFYSKRAESNEEVYRLKSEAFDMLKKRLKQYPELKAYVEALDDDMVNKYSEGKPAPRMWSPLLMERTFDNYETPSDGSQEMVMTTWAFMSSIIRRPQMAWKNLVEHTRWDELPYPGREGRWKIILKVSGVDLEADQMIIRAVRQENSEWQGSH